MGACAIRYLFFYRNGFIIVKLMSFIPYSSQLTRFITLDSIETFNLYQLSTFDLCL